MKEEQLISEKIASAILILLHGFPLRVSIVALGGVITQALDEIEDKEIKEISVRIISEALESLK